MPPKPPICKADDEAMHRPVLSELSVKTAATAPASEAGPDVNARFSCPASSCWCTEIFSDASIEHQSGVYYRTAHNRVTGEDRQFRHCPFSAHPLSFQRLFNRDGERVSAF